MNGQELAEKSVAKMLSTDGFSKWLGVELVELQPGRVKLKMKIRNEMLNGFNICHGGIPFSLADSAMAFASNSSGKINLSIENNISYISKIKEGDELIAVAEEISANSKIAIYNVNISKNHDSAVAFFKGIVYKTDRELFSSNE